MEAMAESRVRGYIFTFARGGVVCSECASLVHAAACRVGVDCDRAWARVGSARRRRARGRWPWAFGPSVLQPRVNAVGRIEALQGASLRRGSCCAQGGGVQSTVRLTARYWTACVSCVFEILAKFPSPARLVTRTKESNNYASIRVENPDAQ